MVITNSPKPNLAYHSPWQGKTALITGASSGLGFEVALYLTSLGFHVFGTTRDKNPNPPWKEEILKHIPQGQVTSLCLDLGSLKGIAKIATWLSQNLNSVDILINNAGIMAPLKLGYTEDGYEQQFGVNYLGHFALTYHLRTLLRGGIIVNVSSLAANRTSCDFSMVEHPRNADRWALYQKSKLALLLFSEALYSKAKRHHWPLHVRAAHPGWARTNIINRRLTHARPLLRYGETWITKAGLYLFGQSAARGALPILYAALSPQARDGRYYGPCGWGQHRGFPKAISLPKAAQNIGAQEELWSASERQTGCYWPLTI